MTMDAIRVSAVDRSKQRGLEVESLIMEALKTLGASSLKEVEAYLNLGRKSVQWIAKRLEKRGLIFASGASHQRRLALTQEAANAAVQELRDRPRERARRDKIPAPRASETRLISPASVDLTPRRPFLDVDLGERRVQLPIVRADEVGAPDALFWCPFFASTLRAEACVGRQRLAGGAVSWKEWRSMGGGGSGSPASPIPYARCGGCHVGAIVAERITPAARAS